MLGMCKGPLSEERTIQVLEVLDDRLVFKIKIFEGMPYCWYNAFWPLKLKVKKCKYLQKAFPEYYISSTLCGSSIALFLFFFFCITSILKSVFIASNSHSAQSADSDKPTSWNFDLCKTRK